MASRELPEQIVTRYRTLACERLERIESYWGELVRGESADADREAELHREVHTLKGDSKVVGFSDVNLLCQKLEDVLFCAREQRYRVSDELDVVATMAMQFMGMLVRKKVGTSLGGIDLAGFLRELDGVLRNARVCAEPGAGKGAVSTKKAVREAGDSRIAAETRHRLADSATSIFLESLAVPESSADRLRAVWRNLTRELAAMEAVPLGPALDRHRIAAEELAKELGKSVKVTFELDGVCVAQEMVTALDTAVLHALRNAVDHGVELPEVRARTAKPPEAKVTLRAVPRIDSLQLEVIDDGGGIDLECVRRRAVEKNFLTPEQATAASEPELFALLSYPGFSTRTEVTEISGRGIGMDAVRAALVKVGGEMELRSKLGSGTTLLLSVPRVSHELDVHLFSVPNSRGVVAVSSEWAMSTEDVDSSNIAQEPFVALHLAPPSVPPLPAGARSLVLRRQGTEVRLLVKGSVRQARAQRLCPNGADHPVEVVAAGGVEAVLLHDQFLLFLAESQPVPALQSSDPSFQRGRSAQS